MLASLIYDIDNSAKLQTKIGFNLIQNRLEKSKKEDCCFLYRALNDQ